MEGVVVFLILVALWLLLAPIIALVKAGKAEREAAEAREQVRDLQRKLGALEAEVRQAGKGSGGVPQAEVAMDEVVERVRKEERRITAAEASVPPPLPPDLPRRKPVDIRQEEQPIGEKPAAVVPGGAAREAEPAKEPFSLEHFMGVKLFAWLGGVAMFFGVIFFVKYAFENNLIPPAVRIALGFVTGTGLLVGGLMTHRLPRYRVLAQAFCATGVVSLYGVSFAAHAIYHFAAFGPVSTFVLMGLITVVAFLVAVRLEALVVAVLGMLGGFLTPVLLSTGHDNVLGLFGYIALLDIGLLAVSRHRRWGFLTSAAAAGTVLIQIGWYSRFFVSGRYFEGAQTLLPMGLLIFFVCLFLAAAWIAKRMGRLDWYSSGSVPGLALVAMVFAFAMLQFSQVADRYFLLYGFVLLVQLAVIAAVVLCPRLGAAQVVAAGLVFLHLALWSTSYLTTDNLMGALVLYFGFGALHSVVPVVMSRRSPGNTAMVPLRVGPWFAPLALLMMLWPVIRLAPAPVGLWVAVLMVDLLVIGMAVATGAVLPVIASLLMTMGVAALWLFNVPASADSLMPFLGVVTGFAAVFAVAGKWLFPGALSGARDRLTERRVAGLLPVASGMLPFALLVLALLQLPVANPSPVFGVALLMTVLLLGLSVIGKQGVLVLAALVSTLAVEGVWHAQHFQAESPTVALSWYLGFYGLFLAFPFVFRKACEGQTAPWIASALSGVGHFLLVHDLVKQAYPNGMMGLIPAAFAVPSLLALVVVLRSVPGMDRKNRSQLAWFGGVALFFITLVFPIQFDRQWLTVSWALEGALLLWLFRRVPHPGLQLVGLALLAVSFIRLAMNPAVFTDYPRSGTAILNWHLYTYGAVAAAQFLGGHWMSDPEGRWSKVHPRGVLFAMGGGLMFILLNIEIADYFTKPGDRFVAFRFGGNFARDMTYSIAWGLFSLGLLGLGIWKGSKHARFAAIGLLVITLLKVFLHDLAAIENIFRIGALVGVAVIAFAASFLYQRFFDRPQRPS